MQEVIYYKGKTHFLDSEPLETYSKLSDNIFISTSIHRGFTCVWSIINNHLFLVSLGGSRNGIEVNGLELVFPECLGPVFASWYTGTLTLQSGNIIADFVGNPLYEKEDVIKFRDGIITGMRSFKRDGSPICMLDPCMYQKVECNDLFHPETIQKLCSSGVVYVGDLVSSDAFTLMKKAKLSVSETEDLVEVLAARGLTLGMHIPGWPPESFDLDERAKQSSKRQQLVEINIKTSPR